jgi:hypothetical protein
MPEVEVLEVVVVVVVVRWWSGLVVDWDGICCIRLHCMVLRVTEGVLLTKSTHPLVI